MLALVAMWGSPPSPAGAQQPDPAALSLACPEPIPAAPFTDVPASNVHARAIACLVAWEITQGRTPTSYGPADPVNRGQMATFLARMIRLTGAELPAPTTPAFTDSTGTHTANIEALAVAGIVQGTTATTCSPEQQVNRAQLSTFLDRTLREVGIELPDGPLLFTGVSGGVHAPAIARLAAAGVVQGTGPETFNPGGIVTRDQMASFLMRTADLMVAEGLVQPPYVEAGPQQPGDGEEPEAPEEPDAPEQPEQPDDPADTGPGEASGVCRDLDILLAESGEIAQADQVDTFELDLVEGQRVTFRPDSLSSSIRWRLVDGFGDPVFGESGASPESTRTVQIEQAGTYRLRIFARGTALGTYRFSVLDATDG